MGAHAYATIHRLQGLAAAAFTWSNAYAAADRIYVNDGRLDKRMSIGSVATTVNVVIDLGSAQALNGFALLNHNLVHASGAAVTVLIEGADNAAMSTNPVTAKAASTLASYNSYNQLDPRNKDHVLQFATVTKRYWRLTFTWTGTINPTFGEIFALASQTTLSRKGIYGSGDGEQMYTSELTFGNGESRGLYQGGPVRRKTLRWQDLNLAERNELQVLWYATRGNASKLLFIDSYEATATAAAAAEQACIYGRLSGLSAIDYPEMDFSLFSFPDTVVQSLGREVGA